MDIQRLKKLLETPMTLEDIGADLGVTKQAVSYAMKQHKIKRSKSAKEPKISHEDYAKLKYGQKKSLSYIAELTGVSREKLKDFAEKNGYNNPIYLSAEEVQTMLYDGISVARLAKELNVSYARMYAFCVKHDLFLTKQGPKKIKLWRINQLAKKMQLA